jgi:toxin ParE1/3/4
VAYYLTNAAEQDIIRIYRHGIRVFGEKQAEKYHNGLEQVFSFLTEHPLAARERHELSPPLRIYPYGAHIILYKREGDDILIVRVRHAHEDWSSNPVDN